MTKKVYGNLKMKLIMLKHGGSLKCHFFRYYMYMTTFSYIKRHFRGQSEHWRYTSTITIILGKLCRFTSMVNIVITNFEPKILKKMLYKPDFFIK